MCKKSSYKIFFIEFCFSGMKTNVMPFIVFHYLLYSQHTDGSNKRRCLMYLKGTFVKGKVFLLRSVYHSRGGGLGGETRLLLL